ncbi:MAG: hypothetical protein RBT68_01715 [Spirochaetia bacterium]|jgi:hypothetical protein|nr:hypothetical protein [Spirochaetia bacterium]
MAEDDTISFVLAPPPVGYPVFTKGEKTTQAGGNAVFLTTEQGGEKMIIAGGTGFGHWQSTVSDTLSLGLNAGGSLLAGSKYDLVMVQVPMQANAVFAAVTRPAWSAFLFGGVGADIGLTTMTIDIPQSVGMLLVEDPTQFNTTTIMSSGSVGVQFNVTIQDFIASPFGSWTYTAGTYSYTQTSAMSFDYPSGSGTIDGSSSTILGFDLLYRPWDISLSSMVRMTDSYTLVTLAVKRLLKRTDTRGEDRE